MISIFGWSYPPGCSGPPEDPEICEICGDSYDKCECPECPICEDVGNPDCYLYHGMKRTKEQKFSLESNERYWKTDNFLENEFYKEIEKNTFY